MPNESFGPADALTIDLLKGGTKLKEREVIVTKPDGTKVKHEIEYYDDDGNLIGFKDLLAEELIEDAKRITREGRKLNV